MKSNPELQNTDNIWRSIIRIGAVLIPGLYFMSKHESYRQINNHRRGIIVGLIISLAIVLSSYLVQIRYLGMQYQLPTGFTTWLNWIIVSPVAEEILFRGVVFQELKKHNHWVMAAILSSLLFVGLHIPTQVLIDQQSTLEIMKYSLHLFMISLLFTYAVHKSRSLWASILPHWTNNLISTGLG
jgi:membrane protease YdiL (CAAX protease family)